MKHRGFYLDVIVMNDEYQLEIIYDYIKEWKKGNLPINRVIEKIDRSLSEIKKNGNSCPKCGGHLRAITSVLECTECGDLYHVDEMKDDDDMITDEGPSFNPYGVV